MYSHAVVGLYAFNPAADEALLLADARWQASAATGAKSAGTEHPSATSSDSQDTRRYTFTAPSQYGARVLVKAPRRLMEVGIKHLGASHVHEGGRHTARATAGDGKSALTFEKPAPLLKELSRRPRQRRSIPSNHYPCPSVAADVLRRYTTRRDLNNKGMQQWFASSYQIVPLVSQPLMCNSRRCFAIVAISAMRFGPVHHTLRCLTRSNPAKQSGVDVAATCAHLNIHNSAASLAPCPRLCPVPSSVPKPDHPSVKASQLAARWSINDASSPKRPCAATIAAGDLSTATHEATSSSNIDTSASAALPSLQQLEDSIGQLSTAPTVTRYCTDGMPAAAWHVMHEHPEVSLPPCAGVSIAPTGHRDLRTQWRWERRSHKTAAEHVAKLTFRCDSNHQVMYSEGDWVRHVLVMEVFQHSRFLGAFW